MARLNSLLYSVLAFMLFAVSANADSQTENYKMLIESNNMYIYNTKDGTVFLLAQDINGKPVMMNIPYANGQKRFPTPKLLMEYTCRHTKP